LVIQGHTQFVKKISKIILVLSKIILMLSKIILRYQKTYSTRRDLSQIILTWMYFIRNHTHRFEGVLFDKISNPILIYLKAYSCASFLSKIILGVWFWIRLCSHEYDFGHLNAIIVQLSMIINKISKIRVAFSDTPHRLFNDFAQWVWFWMRWVWF